MMATLYRHVGARGVLQIALFVACSWAVVALRSRLQSDVLSDADALVYQTTGMGVLVGGAILAATLSRRPGSRRSGAALRAVPVCLMLLAAAFAKVSYADVSVEIEAIREARQPRGPETRVDIGPTGIDVRLSGEITEGAAGRLATLLDANPTISRIHLTSEGGLADEGQALGDVIAAHHLTTFVPDYCVSACTLAFIRGRERLMLADSRLGFHAPYQPALFGQILQGDVGVQRDAYVDAGVASDFVDAALRVPSAEIWIPDAARLIAARVATGVVDRFRFPDSSLDGEATLEAARASLLRGFSILEGLGHSSRVVDMIANWYLEAYLAGRSEGETAAGLQRIVGAAVAVAVSRADDATLAGVAAHVAHAMAAATTTDACQTLGTRVDLAMAARVAPTPGAAFLLRAASEPEHAPPRSVPACRDDADRPDDDAGDDRLADRVLRRHPASLPDDAG